MPDLDTFPEPILAIETSCDETAAAVVQGTSVLSNVVASQIEMHQKWGGVVPEAAARAHVEAVLPVVIDALAGRVVGAVAVTNRPGLVGALSVGVSTAKALSMAWGVPMIGVHHLEGHVLSVLADGVGVPFPHLSLIVSGGHTEIVRVDAPGRYKLLGQTIDDAAGEAFDKGARLLGLGYPGGRAVQDAARNGDPKRYPLPRGLSKDPLNFSFSGLKTAVLRLVEKEGDRLHVADAAASLQAAIVDSLSKKALGAMEETGAKALSLVGGVAANVALRSRLSEQCGRLGVPFFAPRMDLCTDNAAMIGIAGSVRLMLDGPDDIDLDCLPNAPLP
ncbi:MAG: tRNA (adenosine(37)-N6)-threonylcarbamoyltransferase complex transferase subunit TsaD [Armatimonadetes bacterium]|nr:tRNA (adenosine(37)-N6)-threonylcarbamoyltransferase complex transferase subunit TsaD [Armatimonadota bacterium]